MYNNLKSTTLYNCVQQSQSPASQSPRLDSVSEQSLISDLCLQVLPINQTSLYLPGAFKKVMGTFIFFLLSECFFLHCIMMGLSLVKWASGKLIKVIHVIVYVIIVETAQTTTLLKRALYPCLFLSDLYISISGQAGVITPQVFHIQS